MKKIYVFVSLIIIVSASIPRFYDIYRKMAFNSVPRDDYAPYLLFIIGENPGFTPNSPYVYRFFSYMIASPFVKILPVYQFVSLSGVDSGYLRATQSLALCSYLFTLATSGMIYLIANKRLHLPFHSSLIAALIAYILFEFTSMVGVDPIAIFWISVLIYLLQQPILFALLVVISAGVNEKIPFLFILLWLTRFFTERKMSKNRLQLLASFLSMGIYLIIRYLWRFPGNEYQISLKDFFASTIHTLQVTASIKGTIVNTIPILMLFLIYFVAVRSNDMKDSSVFTRFDLVPFLGLIVLGLCVRLGYNLGRIAMYSFPLYLPAASASLTTLFRS